MIDVSISVEPNEILSTIQLDLSDKNVLIDLVDDLFNKKSTI